MLGDNLFAERVILFTNVSRLKAPVSSNIKFTKKQLERMKLLMKPGDLIFTFSSGYMSNIFLPGKFKHGITYIGSPADRKAAGLPKSGHIEAPPARIEKMNKDLKVARQWSRNADSMLF